MVEVSGFDGKQDQLQREYNNLQRKINDCQNQLKNRGGIAEKIKRMEDKVANLRRELAQDTGKRKDELRKHAKQHTLEYIGHIVQMVDKVTDVRQVRLLLLLTLPLDSQPTSHSCLPSLSRTGADLLTVCHGGLASL